ncbi:MAG: hypothetical protein PHV82_11485 [Victivallaceae bacterium]|nr:hypothetical protein [Victivallaceae bacterium]
MKVSKILKINSEIIPIVSDTLALEQGAAGRGIFAVRSEKALSGIAELSIGLDQDYELFCSGYIESCRQIDKQQQRIVIREFSGTLAGRCALAMRNVNAIDVLTAIGKLTGLAFRLEDAEWNKKAMPYFFNIGSGFEALQLLGAELGIANFVWQSQADGIVYVGSLEASRVYKNPLRIPAEFFKELSATGAGCPIIRGFRPGRRIRIGDGDILTIDKVTVSAENMRINFQ